MFDIVLSSPGSGFNISLTITPSLELNPSDITLSEDRIRFEGDFYTSGDNSLYSSDILQLSLTRTFIESFSAADVVLKNSNHFVSEIITHSDVLAKEIGCNLTDTSQSIESLIKASFKVFNDGLTSSENISRNMSKIFLDILDTQDPFSYTRLMRELCTVTIHSIKGQPLTFAEFDNNLACLNSKKVETSAYSDISASFTPVENQSNYIIDLSGNLNINNAVFSKNQTVLLMLKSSVTRSITWDTMYRGIGVMLPTEILSDNSLYIGMIYNRDDVKFDILSVLQL
jgi:hypothetical protein